MTPTVKDLYALIDQIAPFATQEAWDNAGLLAGAPDRAVSAVVCALDLTGEVIEFAQSVGAQLIVTHHPILFHARKHLREDDPEGALLCKLIRSGCALIAAHTNFDRAQGGVNDCLAQRLGLENVTALEDGLRLGDWSGTLKSLGALCEERLGATVRFYGSADHAITRVAVCGGAGGSLWKIAHAAGADCFVTGEVHHSDALDATSWGMALLECGHLETERPSVKAMRMGLQNRLDALQWDVMVVECQSKPF
ncbi:MAG: Nif3-like dinuclear metal center hexameric protein [Clostridia bacterium]